jgi:hypothetical protein
MANTRVYFMSTDDLKSYTTIDYNVEDKLLEISIYDAQQIDIQAQIGTRLYKALETQIIADTLAGDYKILLDDYIFNVLLKSAQKRALMFVYAKIRNKGVQIQDSDNSTPVDITILNKMRDEISNDFEYFSNKLKQFLCESDIPEYDTYNPDSLSYYTVPDKDDSYFSGLYLGDTTPRDWRNDK